MGHSAVITDLKGELWSVTAGWRKVHAGNKVIRFDPASPKGECLLESVGWNQDAWWAWSRWCAKSRYFNCWSGWEGAKRPLAENQSGASCWCDFACLYKSGNGRCWRDWGHITHLLIQCYPILNGILVNYGLKWLPIRMLMEQTIRW